MKSRVLFRRGAGAATAVGCVAVLGALVLPLAAPATAKACGCLSPPDPQVLGSDDFAVNQQAEQIIFETDEVEGTTTAHVLIKYAGAPEEFAWLVPVPNAPQLEISSAVAFAMIDQATAPFVGVGVQSLCPDPEYICRFHDYPDCGDGDTDGAAGEDGHGVTGGGTSGGGDGEGGDGPPPGIDVIDMQQVGSYETVTFAADDAGLAVTWLQENGFIVNDSMTPYMQPYIDGGMVFVAARLVAGAGIDEIAPLEMTYIGPPMIPLQLTAVAAEPHLTVTGYFFGERAYHPEGHPLAIIDPTRISSDASGRVNYPMVLARTIDEAGRDAFVREYEGRFVAPSFNDGSGCCGAADSCNLQGDGECQCPADDFDAADCSEVPGLLEGLELAERLQDYPTMTRLTTRLSPEEMTFDPVFASGPNTNSGLLTLTGQRWDLSSCAQDVIDTELYEKTLREQACSTVYCGEGECVVTDDAAGCACDAGFVGKRFTDLDGLESVTCVPEIGPVDLGLATTLPDVCAAVDCGSGSCVPVGGFPTCQCDPDNAAMLRSDLPVTPCEPIGSGTGSPGAQDFSASLQQVKVCAPAPSACGEYGWLVPNTNKSIQGELCPTSMASLGELRVPPEPTCEALYGDTYNANADGGGCGCTADGSRGLGWMALSLVLLGGWRLRRRS